MFSFVGCSAIIKFTMNKSKKFLKEIAAENKNVMKNISIPSTVRMKYNESNIIRCPATDETKVFFLETTTCNCVRYIVENKISEHIFAHSFASDMNPGGGYQNGAKAQEEFICYQTPGLFPSISNKKYPLEPCTVLITPGLKIMRDDENYELLPEEKFVEYGVVSAAAQNLNRHGSTYDDRLTKKTLANIFCSVKLCYSKTDTLILGAMGCGVFANDPYVIANEIKDAVQKFGGYYKNIFIAIPNGPNVKEFKEVFGFLSESDDENDESDDQDVELQRFEEESAKKGRSKKSDRKKESARKHGVLPTDD